jgi:hypothetical protein
LGRCSELGADEIGFVSQNAVGQISSLLLGRLSKAQAWPATIFVDELDACGLHVALHRLEETAAAVLKLYSDRQRHRPLE